MMLEYWWKMIPVYRMECCYPILVSGTNFQFHSHTFFPFNSLQIKFIFLNTFILHTLLFPPTQSMSFH
ncbi:hypothetical protein VNO80_22430 [Phaseolus coccineus]|uniref:Uncharacterized protein n=1 Tax=Phaseolus coccineus TaxID=3886 RepID=A0AAN9M802_PHACN